MFTFKAKSWQVKAIRSGMRSGIGFSRKVKIQTYFIAELWGMSKLLCWGFRSLSIEWGWGWCCLAKLGHQAKKMKDLLHITILHLKTSFQLKVWSGQWILQLSDPSLWPCYRYFTRYCVVHNTIYNPLQAVNCILKKTYFWTIILGEETHFLWY